MFGGCKVTARYPMFWEIVGRDTKSNVTGWHITQALGAGSNYLQ